jgi:hypothetical protein
METAQLVRMNEGALLDFTIHPYAKMEQPLDQILTHIKKTIDSQYPEDSHFRPKIHLHRIKLYFKPVFWSQEQRLALSTRHEKKVPFQFKCDLWDREWKTNNEVLEFDFNIKSHHPFKIKLDFGDTIAIHSSTATTPYYHFQFVKFSGLGYDLPLPNPHIGTNFNLCFNPYPYHYHYPLRKNTYDLEMEKWFLSSLILSTFLVGDIYEQILHLMHPRLKVFANVEWSWIYPIKRMRTE